MSIRAPITCQLNPEELRDKALVALEDAVQECRYRTPRRGFALRFALAYLWAYAGGSRKPFDRLCKDLGARKSPWSFSVANTSIGWVYKAVRVERDEAVVDRLWRRWTDEMGNGGC